MIAVLLIVAPIWTLVLPVAPQVAGVGAIIHGILIVLVLGREER